MTGELSPLDASKMLVKVRSDKDTNFIGAIVEDAAEDESIAGLPMNKVMIKKLTIQSKQNLDFIIIFFATNGFDNTDLDEDKFEEFVRFKLESGTEGLDWIRIGAANQYYSSKSGLNIPYEDEDGTNTLHMSLLNLSSTSKNAGATGEVVVEASVEPRYD